MYENLFKTGLLSGSRSRQELLQLRITSARCRPGWTGISRGSHPSQRGQTVNLHRWQHAATHQVKLACKVPWHEFNFQGLANLRLPQNPVVMEVAVWLVHCIDPIYKLHILSLSKFECNNSLACEAWLLLWPSWSGTSLAPKIQICLVLGALLLLVCLAFVAVKVAKVKQIGRRCLW